MLASIDNNDIVHLICDNDALHMQQWALPYKHWRIQDRFGKYTLSTIFLGQEIDGMLFETALIYDLTCHVKQRYATADEAKNGHTKWLGSLII